jgi:hypothetical protein
MGKDLCLQKVAKNWLHHRLSLNRPTKRGKEKSPSDGHCQFEKEMNDHLLWRGNKSLKERHIVTHFASEHHF